MAHVLSLFCLLRSAPSLEELEFVGSSDCSQTEEFKADYEFFSVQWSDNMFTKLQVVQMNRIICVSNAMRLMEFILSKARILLVLSVRFAPDALCADKAIIALKGYPRASPDAQVIILGNEYTNIGSITTCSKKAKVEETQTTNSTDDSIHTPTDNAEVNEPQAGGSGHVSVDTITENAVVERTHTTSSWLDSIDLSPENSDMKEAQTIGSRSDSMDTSADNAEVEEAQTASYGHGSVNTFTENARVYEINTGSCVQGSFDMSPKNADVGEAQKTGSNHDSIDTVENAEVENGQTVGSGHGSVNTFTQNAVMGEAPTTGQGNDSMDTSHQKADVEEERTPPSRCGSVSSFTKNAGVDGTQTVSGELVYDVCPLRRKRLDLESVSQLEQLEEEKLELQRQIQLELDDKKKLLEQRMLAQDSFIRQHNTGSSLKSLCELVGITLPPFPKLSSAMSPLPANSGVGDTRVNPGVGGATDDRAVSP